MAKKKFMIAAACLAAAMAIGGLAACGGEEEPNNENSGGTNTDTPAASTSISYQFTGNYTDSTLTGLGYDYYILLNLYSDGTVKGSGYNVLSMDSSAYASNSGFSENWWTGSWEATQNEENVDCISLKVSYGSDAKNLMSGGALLEGSFEYELYESSTGTITFTIDCPIFSGRTQEISGSSTVQYADLDAFIQGNLYTWTAPDNILEFETTSDGADAKLYLQDDGTALFYKGIEDPATSEVKYLLSETWSWNYAEGDLTLVTSGNASITAEISGNAASFTYTATIYGYDTVYNFACSDISVLSQYENVSGGGDETAAVVTFTESGGGTLILYSDNTAVLSAYSGALTTNYTWSYDNGSLVLTDAEDSAKTLTATIEGTAATISYSATLGGYEISFTFTCDDISAITSASEAVTAVVTFTEAGGGTLVLNSDNTAVLSAYSGALTVNYTWSYDNGSLVLTDADDSAKTLTATIDGAAATIAYSATLGGYEISFTFTCDDISAVIS